MATPPKSSGVSEVYINWVNDKLKQSNGVKREIESVAELGEAEGGDILLQLVEILANTIIRPASHKYESQEQRKSQNYHNVLKVLRDKEKVFFGTRNADHLGKMSDGDIKSTGKIIEILIKHYHIGEQTAKEDAFGIVMEFVEEKLADRQILVKMISKWNDGIILSMLVNSLKPGIIPNVADLKPEDALSNTRTAMELAEQHFGIPQICAPEHICVPQPNGMMIMTYLGYFLERNFSAKVKSLNDRISHGTKQEETQIDILKQELSDARAQVLTKEGEVHSLQEQASDLNIQLDSKNEVISKLHSDNDEISRLAKENDTGMNKQIDSLKEKIKDNDDRLEEKNTKISQLLMESYNKDEVKNKLEKEKDDILSKTETANKTYQDKEQRLTEKANASSKRVEEEMKRFTKIQQEKSLLQKELQEMATRLKVDDLYEVTLLTANIQGQWEDIGNVLKVPHEELESISTKYSSSVTRCHYEMMRYWIMTIGGSLKGLADALKHNSIKQEDLAKEILDIYENGNNRTAHFQLLKNEIKVSKGAELIPYNIFTDVDWRVLGLLLGLSDSTLESIQIKSSSEEQCQQSMIDQWISTGQAYWSLLVDALEGPVLGEIDLASKIVEEHFAEDAHMQARGGDEPAIEGTYAIDNEKVKQMQEKILTTITNATSVRDGVQVKGIMFAFAMTVVKGARIDLNNVTATFEEHLQFAVYRVEDIKGEDLANFIKAAATAKYPLSCKHKAFYFAGHGGMDKHNRPFFKPVAENESEVFLIRENILAHFQKTKPKDKFMFFFDCCLSQAKPDQDTSTPSDVEFSLKAPVRCVIAYATSAGIKSFGDTEKGGRWTSSLCENLKKQIELGEVLTITHEEVMKKSEDRQPPYHLSCIGPIYLKGMPEPSIQQHNGKDEGSKQNVLKRHHSDLFQILHNNETVLTSLVTALSMDCIIDKQLQDKIIREKHKKETVTLFLNRLEQKLDNQPEILGKLFERMEHFEGELRNCVIGMRKESKDNDEETITTDLFKAFDQSKTENEELKERVKTLEQEKERQDKQMVDEKKNDHSINELKEELMKVIGSYIQKYTAD